jgi:P27 family predicted phage terminase small subunit
LDTACPAELVDEVAREEWSRTIEPAIRLGHVTLLDRTLAISHCETWAMRRAQLAEAAKYPGHVVEVGRDRYPRQNPALKLAADTLSLLIKIDAELGLTPTARARVTIKPKAPRLALIDRQRATFFEGEG